MIGRLTVGKMKTASMQYVRLGEHTDAFLRLSERRTGGRTERQSSTSTSTLTFFDSANQSTLAFLFMQMDILS